MFKKFNPIDFSVIFLNSGAHIQHHYLLSSAFINPEMTEHKNPEWYVKKGVDPLLDMIKIYDLILSDYCSSEDFEVIVCTGLSQIPYDRVKYYYRLKNHINFFNKLGIKFLTIEPRMTRDFLVKFKTICDASHAKDALSSIVMHQTEEKLFGVIDQRVANYLLR